MDGRRAFCSSIHYCHPSASLPGPSMPRILSATSAIVRDMWLAQGSRILALTLQCAACRARFLAL